MVLFEKKKKALDFFLTKLLKAETASNVAKIYLFGSFHKGEFDERSDIDILIVSFNGKEELDEFCLDLSFDISSHFAEFIETHIYDIYDWQFPPNYLVYRVKKGGREIYSVDEKEIKRREIEGFMELAQEYLNGSEHLIRNGFYRGAIDQAYNALELCLKGFLLFKMEDLPGRHSSVIEKFIEYYLKPEIFPRNLSKKIKHAFKKRNNARYNPSAYFNEKDAEGLISLTREMLENLQPTLTEW